VRKLTTLHKRRCRREEAHETCFLSEEGGHACRGFVQTVIAETSQSNHDVKLKTGGIELAEFPLRHRDIHGPRLLHAPMLSPGASSRPRTRGGPSASDGISQQPDVRLQRDRSSVRYRRRRRREETHKLVFVPGKSESSAPRRSGFNSRQMISSRKCGEGWQRLAAVGSGWQVHPSSDSLFSAPAQKPGVRSEYERGSIYCGTMRHGPASCGLMRRRLDSVRPCSHPEFLKPGVRSARGNTGARQ